MNNILESGSNTGGTFELVPEGKHLGVLRFAVDCGHHRDSYQGVETIKHLIFMGWELNCEDANGNPHWKGDFYTATDFINSKTGEPDWFFGSTSNFNKILRGWTGVDADTCKWKSFSAKLMRTATPCYVNIEHQEDKKDATKVYSRIDSIKPVKGGDTFKPKREVVSWTFGMEGLDSLPGNIKKKILASIEQTEGSYTIPPKKPKATDDSIPF